MEAEKAEALVRRYAAAWAANDREGWLDTFAPGATQEDPVGEVIRTGRADIGAFWDGAMASYDRLEIRVRAVHVTGGEAALEWTIVAEDAEATVTFDGVDAFSFADGLIASVRAYWAGDRRIRTPRP